MNARTRNARARRAALIAKLGGKCALCPTKDRLQLDCIVPADPSHHRLNAQGRCAFYEAQHAIGNLQALCPPCHLRKTQQDIAARVVHTAQVSCPKCAFLFRLAGRIKLPGAVEMCGGLEAVAVPIRCKHGTPLSEPCYICTEDGDPRTPPPLT